MGTPGGLTPGCSATPIGACIRVSWINTIVYHRPHHHHHHHTHTTTTTTTTTPPLLPSLPPSPPPLPPHTHPPTSHQRGIHVLRVCRPLSPLRNELNFVCRTLFSGCQRTRHGLHDLPCSVSVVSQSGLLHVPWWYLVKLRSMSAVTGTPSTGPIVPNTFLVG